MDNASKTSRDDRKAFSKIAFAEEDPDKDKSTRKLAGCRIWTQDLIYAMFVVEFLPFFSLFSFFGKPPLLFRAFTKIDNFNFFKKLNRSFS
jgi:hypothetical protein